MFAIEQLAQALQLTDFADQHDIKVSVNDIVIKAVAIALRNVPEANGKMCFICSRY